MDDAKLRGGGGEKNREETILFPGRKGAGGQVEAKVCSVAILGQNSRPIWQPWLPKLATLKVRGREGGREVIGER